MLQVQDYLFVALRDLLIHAFAQLGAGLTHGQSSLEVENRDAFSFTSCDFHAHRGFQGSGCHRGSAGLSRSSSSTGPAGSDTVKRVPLCSSLSTDPTPPCAFTIHDTKLNPSPSPFSGSAEGTR